MSKARMEQEDVAMNRGGAVLTESQKRSCPHCEDTVRSSEFQDHILNIHPEHAMSWGLHPLQA